MLQNISKFNLVFLLFFCVGTASVYAQYDESNEEWVDYYYGNHDDDSDYQDFLNGTSSGGSSSGGGVTWSNTLYRVAESNSSRAAIWEGLCQSQSSSSTYEASTHLIQNSDNCMPNLDTIIAYLATFHSVQNNGSTAFVENTYNLINRSSDEVFEKLVNSFPNNSGIRGMLWNNISSPYPSSTAQTIKINFLVTRNAIGDENGQYYTNIVHFDLWLEGKIRTYLLQNYNYNSVEFDNY